MKTRTNIPNTPFMSMKVDNFYKMTKENESQSNPPEMSAYATYGRPGDLTFGYINPVQDGSLLASQRNIDTGNVFEQTKPGYTIKRFHFEEIIGASVLNHQNAYN